MSDIDQQIANLSPAKRAILEHRLREKAAKTQSQIKTIDRLGPLPLSFAQQRMWFIDQLEPGNPIYNRPTYFRLRGTLNVEVLTQSLVEVARRHEVLRSHFPSINGKPTLNIVPEILLSLPVTDLSLLSEPTEQLQTHLCQEAQQPFDLANGPLLRSQLIKLGETEHLLLITLGLTQWIEASWSK